MSDAYNPSRVRSEGNDVPELNIRTLIRFKNDARVALSSTFNRGRDTSEPGTYNDDSDSRRLDTRVCAVLRVRHA